MSKILSIQKYYLKKRKNFGLIQEYEKSIIRNTDFFQTIHHRKKNYSISTLDNSLEYVNIREIETNDFKDKKKIYAVYLKKKEVLISFFSCNDVNSLLFYLNRVLLCIPRKNIFLKKLIFLKPVRSGFKCISCGLVGCVFLKSVYFLISKIENIFSILQNVNRLAYLKFLGHKINFFFLFHEIKLKFFPSFNLKKRKYYVKKRSFYRKQKLQVLFSIKE